MEKAEEKIEEGIDRKVQIEILDKIGQVAEGGKVEEALKLLGDYRKLLIGEEQKSDEKENKKYKWFLNNLEDFCGHPNSDIMNFEDKEIYVYWSGGFDSTALVAALWRKYKKTIHTFSVFHDWIPNRYADRNARRRLMKEFKKRKWDIENQELELKDEYTGGNNGLGQPPIWLAALILAARGDNRAYCYGYVREDDFWHYVTPFKEVFKNVCQILGNSNSIITFPLEFVEKPQIIRYLKEEGLSELCSYCEQITDELAEEKSCGKCSSCRKHQKALEDLEQLEQREEDIIQQS